MTCGLNTSSSLPLIFVTRLLLEHSHAHLYTHPFMAAFMAELSGCNRNQFTKPKMFTTWPFTEKVGQPVP